MEFGMDFQAMFGVLINLSLGGVSVAVLVLALVQTAKMFGLTGALKIRALAIGLGIFFVALAYGLNEGLIPATWAPYVTWATVALIGGLASMGLWELGERWLPGNGDAIEAEAEVLE